MFEKVVSWFKKDEPEPEKAAPRRTAPAAKPRAEPQPQESQQEAFNAKLKTLCQSRQVVSGGRLNIMNMDGIKARFGAKWDTVSENVSFMIKRSLQQKLGPRDFFSEVGENMFVVVFAGLTPEAAALKCEAVAKEIMTKLFGNDTSGGVAIQSAAVGLDGDMLLNGVNPLDMLVETLEKKAPVVGQKPKSASSESGLGWYEAKNPNRAAPADTSWYEDVRRHSTERADEPTMPIPSGAPTGHDDRPAGSTRAEAEERAVEFAYQRNLYELMRLIGDTNKKVSDWRMFKAPPSQVHYQGAKPSRQGNSGSVANALSPPDRQGRGELEKKVWTERQVKEIERPLKRLELPGSLSKAEFFYQPVWFAGKNAVTTYRSEVRFRGEKGAATIDEILSADSDPNIESLVDMLLLRKGISDLARCLYEGKKSVISVPVHYATILGKNTRSQFMAAIVDAPDSLRQLLAIEFTNLYAADWKLLPNVIQPIKKICRSVVLRVSLDQPINASLTASGAHAIGADFRDHDWDEEHALRAINKFATEAEAAKLTAYIAGLNSKSLVMAAVCAGIPYVSGDAAIPPVELPNGVYPFDPMDLYAKH